MARRASIACPLIVCLLVQPLCAWNNTGHMLVALVAYRNLSTEAKAKAGDMLKNHPHYVDPVNFFKANQPAGVSEEEWAFIKAATWADFVRPHKGQPRPNIDKFHREPWHFKHL